MKKILVVLALTMTGMWAHANGDINTEDATIQGKLSWTCGLTFTGTSAGVKVILGKFSTHATGTLKCVDLEGHHFNRGVSVTMGSYFIGPVVGIGVFKFAGASSEVSVLNNSPEVLFGDYLVAHGQGAIVGGAGTFAAARVKPPEVAINVSLQFVKGFGLQVGIERLTIAPL